jgi:hypothetical protein
MFPSLDNTEFVQLKTPQIKSRIMNHQPIHSDSMYQPQTHDSEGMAGYHIAFGQCIHNDTAHQMRTILSDYPLEVDSMYEVERTS